MTNRDEQAGDRALTRGRRVLLIASLVSGAFGIGVSEFLVMGLLPQIAGDLLPGLYLSDPDAAIAASGGMASAYAFGVVAGMVVTPMLLRRFPERAALLVCAVAMLLGTLLTALAPVLPVAIALRFLSALTHATFVGLGAVVTARMLGPSHQGRGHAIVHGGLTGANLLGVPALTALGTLGDWRVVLGSCALLFAMPVVALLRIAPPEAPANGAPRGSTPARSGAGPGVFVLVGVVTALTGAGFAVVTYVAPLTAWAQGSDAVLSVAVCMLLFGVGMNLGNVGSGWLADRSAELAMWLCALTGAAAVLLLLLPLASPVAVGAGMVLVGVLLGGTSPSSQVLYLRELPRYPRLAASLSSGTANMGSFAGSVVGAWLLASRGAVGVPLGATILLGAGILLLVVRGVLARRPVSPGGRRPSGDIGGERSE